jgi:hypothetical protein
MYAAALRLAASPREARRERPEQQPPRAARSAPGRAAEVDAVGAERERRLDVVVHDEGRGELRKAPASTSLVRWSRL